ncbi:MAG: metallophosphoesterase, partial [Clostridia bacterium]|nr:metallophosphoesterase [Clostridia bacterium]
DFIVEAPCGRNLTVLQISDPQIIDSSKVRFFDRLNPVEKAYWSPDKFDERCYGYLREIIENTRPDLILITGDLVYGEFDDDGKLLREFISFMDIYKTPWAPIFGNHDNESVLGAEWQSEQLENAAYCLFKRGDVSGNGNYTVGITENGELKRVFVMLDTHGCRSEMGLHPDQIAWYNEKLKGIKAVSPSVKISFVMHVQPMVFKDAFAKYGFINEDTVSHPINIDASKNKAESDFGYLGADLKNPWDKDGTVWKEMKELGTDSVFVSHQHSNSGSVIYDGVRFQFGQKSSTYDRANYVTPEKKIVCSFTPAGDPIIGGSVFSVEKTSGKIVGEHIYYCKNAGGNIDMREF